MHRRTQEIKHTQFDAVLIIEKSRPQTNEFIGIYISIDRRVADRNDPRREERRPKKPGDGDKTFSLRALDGCVFHR